MLQGWYGKIFGAILGALIGRGLLGAIIGLVLGHQFDVTERRRGGGLFGRRPLGDASARDGDPAVDGSVPGTGDPDAMRVAFFETTFQVMGHVAKSDGRVTEQEIDAARGAMRRFALSEVDRQRAIKLFTAGKRADFPLEATLERLYRHAGGHPDLRRLFVQIQLEAALQGNGLGTPSRAVFARICRTLRISPLEFAALEAMLRMHAGAAGRAGARGQSTNGPGASASAHARATARLADAYEVLGVAAATQDAEVTRAFRRLMSQNHPDKLVAQGLPESMVTAAHERTQRILEAYETVKSHRGMK